MAVLLGLDLGEKRVGVSRSDETETIAEAFATLTYTSKEELLKGLRRYVEELRPKKIVVGFPQTLGGEVGLAARKVEKRVEWLKARLPLEWVFWDERLSTKDAERVLIEANLSREKRKGLRDRLAAQRILQNYLDANKHH